MLVEARDRRERTFVFRCTHFDPATRSCDSYASRPGMCRDYPRALLQQAHPELLPGCGYRPLARNADALRRALLDEPLTDEQRARLRRELFLERRPGPRRAQCQRPSTSPIVVNCTVWYPALTRNSLSDLRSNR